MEEQHIDLTTVRAIDVHGRHIEVAPGSVRIVRPVFTMADEDGNPVTHYGSHMHPPTITFTSREGTPASAPYCHDVMFTHLAPVKDPEPPHELIEVGKRVLVSHSMTRYPDGRLVRNGHPFAAKIVGYDETGTRYKLNAERPEGGHYDVETYANADERVQLHPDQDGAVVRPTGPRLYVEYTPTGEQGYVVGPTATSLKLRIAFLKPGLPERNVAVTNLAFIIPDVLDRCPNGQTGDECGSGENRCEPCLADDDDEAEAIEGSMGL